jgi:hypothetical protein
MFLENYKLDQGVKELKYIKNDPLKGALLTVENLGEMAMPIILQYETAGGTKQTVKIPVEVWQNNTSWIIKLNTTEKIKSVIIDADRAFPDINYANNRWASER